MFTGQTIARSLGKNLERAVRLELTSTGFAIRSLSRLATRAEVRMKDEGGRMKGTFSSFIPHPSSFVFGAEGEIRTLEASLEDSHVSSYITSAEKIGTPGRARTRNLDVRSVALFQLSYRSKGEFRISDFGLRISTLVS